LLGAFVGACKNPALCLGKGANRRRHFTVETSAVSGASILGRQSNIGAAFRDTLKDPKKAVESHVQENWGEFKVEVAGHIAVIHLKVERLIFFVVPHSHTFGLSAAMRA
jgi:hypothetical protein